MNEGSQFEEKLFQQMCKVAGTKLYQCRICAHHLNRFAEIVHRYFLQVLNCISSGYSRWESLIARGTRAGNSAISGITGVSPGFTWAHRTVQGDQLPGATERAKRFKTENR